MALEPPPDAGDQGVGQATLPALHLVAGFAPDHGLEVAHHSGVGVWPGGGPDNVEGILDVGDPVAQRLVHGVFQRRRAAGHRTHLRAQQLHA